MPAYVTTTHFGTVLTAIVALITVDCVRELPSAWPILALKSGQHLR